MSNKLVYVLLNTLKDTIYIILISLFLICTFIHPLFAGFILVQIISRLHIGKQIIQSIKESWHQLAIATALMIIVNYLYSIFIYTIYQQYFSPTCQSLYQCLLLMLNYCLWNESGVHGSIQDSIPDSNNQSHLSFKFITDILYIVFAQKVIIDIFAGTLIDKFSELRQKNQQMEQD